MGVPARVLVVDDSSFFRERLVAIFDADPRLSVVGTAADGREAVDQCLALSPDVVTMDHDMPVLDGVGAVREIMARRPTPVIMVSALTHFGSDVTLSAFLAGAMDFVPKTLANINPDSSSRLRDRVANLACMDVLAHKGRSSVPARQASTTAMVVVGSSTGGPAALEQLLTTLPADFPAPVVLVQHLPTQFTRPLAERLDGNSPLQVLVAEHGTIPRAGQVYLAPGGCQLTFSRNRHLVVRRSAPELLNQPSVDVTLDSASTVFGKRVLGLVLTGMGADGAIGAVAVHAAGGRIWVQDPDTALVCGMPKAVTGTGVVDLSLPLDRLAKRLADLH